MQRRQPLVTQKHLSGILNGKTMRYDGGASVVGACGRFREVRSMCLRGTLLKIAEQGSHSMRKSLFIIAAVAATALLAGCPRPNPSGFKYTSADLTGGYRNLGGFLDDMAAGGEGGGGGAPEEPTRELVEPDVIRQVGDTLFVLNQYRGLTLVDLEDQTILDQVAGRRRNLRDLDRGHKGKPGSRPQRVRFSADIQRAASRHHGIT